MSTHTAHRPSTTIDGPHTAAATRTENINIGCENARSSGAFLHATRRACLPSGLCNVARLVVQANETKGLKHDFNLAWYAFPRELLGEKSDENEEHCRPTVHNLCRLREAQEFCLLDLSGDPSPFPCLRERIQLRRLACGRDLV